MVTKLYLTDTTVHKCKKVSIIIDNSMSKHRIENERKHYMERIFFIMIILIK